MLLIPAAVAFFSHAAPLAESMLTIMSTSTFSAIMASQIELNFVASFVAFWMS
ncbi:unannotated protein [freshwater metagenome]|uniref:Unannotated protein n=1 Tax=freshwater metagenome TaxID=449393 RepID=A0A6J7K455_9ZZZZ